MGSIKKIAQAEPQIDRVTDNLVMTRATNIKTIDLYTIRVKDLDFSNTYKLFAKRNDTVHAICVWFDIFFNAFDYKVKFTTGIYINIYTRSIFEMHALEANSFIFN